MKLRLNKFWRDICTGGLATLFAIWLLYGCSTMKKYANNTLAPGQVPSILAYLLLVLAVIVIARAFLRRAKEKKMAPTVTQEKPEKNPVTKAGVFNELIPYLTFLLIGLYLYGIKTIGFSVSTFLYLAIQINLLEKNLIKKNIIRNTILALIIAAVVFTFFNVVLNMHLPTHEWFGLIRI